MSIGEQLAESLWPDETHAVVALPDAGKGERLVLATSCAAAKTDALLDAARTQGIADIMVPRRIRHLDQLPRLGSGKVDYPAVQRLVA
jgi:acyl-[acyl-carrier-protein]-phospholipid O-acyltransferase/long-chain-fatty-acid--[acyl-carrier-protein] ligase